MAMILGAKEIVLRLYTNRRSLFIFLFKMVCSSGIGLFVTWISRRFLKRREIPVTNMFYVLSVLCAIR